MTKAIKLIGVLTVICIVSALSLSYVYNDIAAPVIAAREKEEAVGSLRDIVPDADDFNIIQNDDGKIQYYEVIKGGEVSHVAIPCESSGFGGPVKLIVVTDMDGNIAGVNVAGQSETPGYGDRIITEPWFVEQFEGMSLLENDFVVGNDVDGLAGATVTSGAASRAVQNAAEYFMLNFMEGMAEQLEEQERQEAYDNMSELLPEAEEFNYVQEDGETVYYTASTGGEVTNYGFITESKGLNAPVVILTVTNTEGEIVSNKVISQADTPGYGDRIVNEPEFMEQFIGMNLGEDSFVINETIDGLAGATVTSTGATKAVANASELWMQHLGDGTPAPSQGDSGGDEYDIESIMNENLESIDDYQSKSVDQGKFYLAKSNGANEAVGILTKAEGMTDNVVVLTIADLEGAIIDVIVVEQNDTPSIGEKVIEEEWFTDQYHDMNLASNSFELNNEIDVIASVTVTSTAVNEAVIKASSIWSEYISNGKIDEQVMDSSSEETTGKESTQDNKGEEYDIQSIMNEVLNNGLEYEATTVDNGQYYLSDESVGILTSTKGMVDDVVVLTITDLEGKIIDVVVVEQKDTPSIGEKVIEEEWFTDQYHEMNLLSNSFELNNEIDVIASVTVTSKAVNDSVIKAAELFKENIEEGAGQ